MEAEAEVETSVAYAARQVNLRRSCVARRCAIGGAAHLTDEVGEGGRAELADAHAYELRLPRRRRVEEERRRRLSGSCTKSARPAHMPDIRAKEGFANAPGGCDERSSTCPLWTHMPPNLHKKESSRSSELLQCKRSTSLLDLPCSRWHNGRQLYLKKTFQA